MNAIQLTYATFKPLYQFDRFQIPSRIPYSTWLPARREFAFDEFGAVLDAYLEEGLEDTLPMGYLQALITLEKHKQARTTVYLILNDSVVLGEDTTRYIEHVGNTCKEFFRRVEFGGDTGKIDRPIYANTGLRESIPVTDCLYFVTNIKREIVKNWWDEMTEGDYEGAVIRAALEYLEDEVWQD